MLKKLLIHIGWRGADCSNCGFCHAAHSKPSVQWHPDNSPCIEFNEDQSRLG